MDPLPRNPAPPRPVATPAGPALPLALLLLAACGPEPSTPIIDPPIVQADPNGTWQVVNLARPGTGPLPDDPGAPHPPFRPLHEGMQLVIAGGQVRDQDGAPLFAVWNPAVPNERYTNAADALRVYFDFLSRGTAGCTWHEELSAVFAPRTEDLLQGNVTVVSSSDCADPAPLPAAATGQFMLQLARVAGPLQASSDK
jgi:hypothetical protein